MKHIGLPIAVCLFTILTACNNSGTTTSTGSSSADSSGSMEEQNLAKNRSVYKAIETGDSATIRGLIADDAVDHQGPNGTEIKGGDNITHMLADIHNHMKDLSFEIISDAAKGDYIFAMVRMKGEATDNMFGMKPGTKMDSKSTDVVKVKDGKMVEHWGFVDPASMMPPMDTTKMKK